MSSYTYLWVRQPLIIIILRVLSLPHLLASRLHHHQNVAVEGRQQQVTMQCNASNAHLVDDPTIRQPGFALPRQQWSLLNCFRT